MKPSKRILMTTLALALAIFTVGCSFNVTTAKVEEAIMTNSVDEEGKPGTAVTSPWYSDILIGKSHMRRRGPILRVDVAAFVARTLAARLHQLLAAAGQVCQLFRITRSSVTAPP